MISFEIINSYSYKLASTTILPWKSKLSTFQTSNGSAIKLFNTEKIHIKIKKCKLSSHPVGLSNVFLSQHLVLSIKLPSLHAKFLSAFKWS